MLLKMQPVVERLQGLGVFAEVGGAAQYSVAEELTQFVPAAYVIPIECEAARVNGELSRYSNAVSQHIIDTVAVIIVARDVSDMRGEATISVIEALRELVMDSLIGWTMPGANCEFLYRRGRIEKFNDQTVFWRDEFVTAHDLEK